MQRDLTQLNKLEQWLKDHNYAYERIDKEGPVDTHQVIVYKELDSRRFRSWDAVCHYGSYGSTRGLLEIMGTIVSPEAGDSVEGWLTAEEVIERIQNASHKILQ